MKLFTSLFSAGVLAVSITNTIAASWTFTDGSVSVQSKGTGVGGNRKDNLIAAKPIAKTVDFGPNDSLKIVLTVQEGKTAKRPHQAFLLLKDTVSNLDVSYPMNVKESGKAKLDLTHKELPAQFTKGKSQIVANLVIGSFGSSQGYDSKAFTMDVTTDASNPGGNVGKALRYGKLPEIHHIFRSDPKQPNILISTIFTLGAIAALPILIGSWLVLGGNVNHLSKALSDAPVAHALFVGSIVSLEGILFMYYSSWKLFQVLPALFAVGLLAFVSGSRALTEVQDRRLAGRR